MTQIVFLPGVAEDFERIALHLADHEVEGIRERLDTIVDGCAVLERHPRMGHPVDAVQRELFVGQRSAGYAVLYRYLEAADTVFVVAIKAQREARYRRG